MAREEKLNLQQLMDFALEQVPVTGEINYADLHAKIRASAHPEATQALTELKKRGMLTAKLEATPTGIKHTYARGKVGN